MEAPCSSKLISEYRQCTGFTDTMLTTDSESAPRINIPGCKKLGHYTATIPTLSTHALWTLDEYKLSIYKGTQLFIFFPTWLTEELSNDHLTCPCIWREGNPLNKFQDDKWLWSLKFRGLVKGLLPGKIFFPGGLNSSRGLHTVTPNKISGPAKKWVPNRYELSRILDKYD